MPTMKYLKYGQVGHTCEETWRIAMTVAAVLELMKDDPDSIHSSTASSTSDLRTRCPIK
jgi:hypothetical protein